MEQRKFSRPTWRKHATVAKPSRLEPFLQMLPSLFQALVMAGVAFFVTNRVDQALKDRQVTVTSVREMSTLLESIEKAPETERESVRKKLVRQLSMYGVDAIGPLVILAVSKDMEISVPNEGLTLIAVKHRKEVCDALHSLLESRDLFPDAEPQMKSLVRREKTLCRETVAKQ